jgi:hypothetical protein
MNALKTYSNRDVADNLGDYFSKLYKSKNRWAHLYRSTSLTLLANSTQRVEGQNALIKKVCNSKTTFVHLVGQLEDLVITAYDKSSNEEYSKINKVLIDSSKRCLNNPKQVEIIAQACAQSLSKYCCNIILKQLELAHKYVPKIVTKNGDSLKFKVVNFKSINTFINYKVTHC